MHFAVDVCAADKATEYAVKYVTEYVGTRCACHLM